MQIRNTTSSYGTVSKFFHWGLVLLVLVQFASVYWVLWVLPEKSPAGAFYIDGLHKPIGILVLVMAILAVFWRLSNPKPSFPPKMKAWERQSAYFVHFCLYLVLFVMPITGFIMSSAAGHPPNFFGLYQFPNFLEPNKNLAKAFFEIHEIVSYIAIALVAMHTLAALKHHFIDKDTVLKRMLP